MHNRSILADNGYYKDEIIYENYHGENYTIIMPNKQQASRQKDKLKRKEQRKTNNNKNNGFGKQNMIKDEENNCYVCPENKILSVQQVYPGKYNDRIIYYTSECAHCQSKDICLTNKMTGKIIIDYTSDAKEILAKQFETQKGQELYKQRMPMVEPRFDTTNTH